MARPRSPEDDDGPPPGEEQGGVLARVDAWQRRHRPVAFALAVVKKLGDDQGSNLAAVIAYRAFFSLFPLLLVFVTVLGYVLQGDAALERKVVHGTLSQIPVVGPSLAVGALRGSGLALALGALLALWSGLGVTLAVENAMNAVWNVPHRRRPNFLRARVRGLGLLVVLGVGNIISTVAAGVVGAGGLHGAAAYAGAVLAALGANVALFLGAFRLLTVADVPVRDLLPGVVAASVLWYALQALGGLYVDHVLKGASNTYGTFATVIGLLSFVYLGAQVLLVSAEVNVVRARGLWPRRLFGPPAGPDRRALTARATEEERAAEQRVDVRFEDERAPG